MVFRLQKPAGYQKKHILYREERLNSTFLKFLEQEAAVICT